MDLPSPQTPRRQMPLLVMRALLSGRGRRHRNVVRMGEPGRSTVSGNGRPWVVTHNSASVDGRIAVSPGLLLMMDERWPVLPGSTYADVKRRHEPTVILEGSGSFVRDTEEPSPLPPATETRQVLLENYLPEKAVAAATNGWLTVPDSRGRVRWLYKQFPGEDWAGWHVLVLVSTATPPEYLSYLRREEIPYLVAGESRVDLKQALRLIRDQFRAETVLSTGGGQLNGALLRAGLVDEIEVEVVPIAIGGEATPTLFTAPDLPVDGVPTQLELTSAEIRSQGRVLLRYSVSGRE
ncbi:MAG: RibD family protein [Mycolicibacterium vanbaalenii]|uniref:dihydrofolate reductase family protein n=1 Tax=Mycolicibacterium vanbaalenii TaxID=110539 RepID=UPI0035647C3A